MGPLEAALLEAPVDTDGKAIRETSGEFNNFLNANISKGGSNDIRGETEESLGDLAGTRVLVVKSSDEEERFTPGVDLIMDRTLGEKGALTRSHRIDDETRSVLLDEPGFHGSIDEEKDLGRSGMGVRGVHSARRHLSDSQGDAVREERREVCDIGDGEASAGALGGTDSSIIIEQPVSVIAEDVETSHLSRGLLQIRNEVGGLGSVGGLSESVESGSEDERNNGEELHDIRACS